MPPFRISLRLLAIAIVTAAVFYLTGFLYGNHRRNIIAYDYPKHCGSELQITSKNMHSSEEALILTPTPEEPKNLLDFSQRRRSLLIFGADRSGTTFISRMFSEDPQMFMIYEPLWVTKAWRKKQPSEDWTRSELEVINGILSCNFTKFPLATRFLAHTSRQWSAASFKNPFLSENFCSVAEFRKKSCPDLSLVPNFAAEMCASRYRHSVTKIAQGRVPKLELSSIVPQVFIENPDTDIKVIQILRDPRGSLASRIKLGWMPNHASPSFVHQVRYPCMRIAENVKYGRNLPEEYRNKYMEVYYRDIAKYPIKTALKIYKFAGFEMPEDLLKWIVVNTSPSSEALVREAGKPFSSVRNSSANTESWRSAPEEQNRIIERECRELMQLIRIEK